MVRVTIRYHARISRVVVGDMVLFDWDDIAAGFEVFHTLAPVPTAMVGRKRRHWNVRLKVRYSLSPPDWMRDYLSEQRIAWSTRQFALKDLTY